MTGLSRMARWMVKHRVVTSVSVCVFFHPLKTNKKRADPSDLIKEKETRKNGRDLKFLYKFVT